MTELVSLMVDNYHHLLEKTRAEGLDPTVDNWFLMSGPVPVLTILSAYLYFVLYLGPRLMAHRKPLQLRRVLIAYNFFQVIYSIYLAQLPFNGEAFWSMHNSCKPDGKDPNFIRKLSEGAWWYFFAKITELLDTTDKLFIGLVYRRVPEIIKLQRCFFFGNTYTFFNHAMGNLVFFVVRKKQSQVTFLHVYHHTITVFFSWCYLKFIPGEQGMMIGFLNSAVHIVMYSYYLIAGLGPQYQKYLWWKKYLTWIQLIQFCLIMMYMASLLVSDCKLPRALTLFFLSNATIFLLLFADFYRKAYSKKSKND